MQNLFEIVKVESALNKEKASSEYCSAPSAQI